MSKKTKSVIRGQLNQYILELLRELMVQQGHGVMAGIQRELDLRATFFSEPHERLDVALVLQALDQLDLPPSEFFARFDRQVDKDLPKVPEGCEGIAEYYRQGKHLRETDDA